MVKYGGFNQYQTRRKTAGLSEHLSLLVGEPNLIKCIIKRDNLCVTGPNETMLRFHLYAQFSTLGPFMWTYCPPGMNYHISCFKKCLPFFGPEGFIIQSLWGVLAARLSGLAGNVTFSWLHKFSRSLKSHSCMSTLMHVHPAFSLESTLLILIYRHMEMTNSMPITKSFQPLLSCRAC